MPVEKEPKAKDEEELKKVEEKDGEAARRTLAH